MSTLTIKNVFAGQPAASAVVVYTCPSLTTARVLKTVACNDTTTAITYKFYKVPSGQAVGDEYLILNDHALGSKETYMNPEIVGQVLDSGDTLVCHPSAATQLSLSVDVVEEVGQ